MGAHAKLSPSGAHAWLVCTAKPDAEARVARPGWDTSSDASSEGTAAHEIASRCLRDSLDADHFLGCTVEVENVTGAEHIPDVDGPSARAAGVAFRSHTVTEEMATAVQTFVDVVRADVDDGDELLVEQRLDFSEYVPGGFGRGDAVVVKYTAKAVHVHDLKYGRGVPVHAETRPGDELFDRGTAWNPQGALYGLGAYAEHGLFADLDTVRVIIHQPRIDSETAIDIAVDELTAWAAGPVADAVAEVEAGGTFRPGEKQCQFCMVRQTCRARGQWMLESVRMPSAAVPAPADIPNLDTGDDTITHEELALLLPRVKELAKWSNDLWAYATEAVERGETVPGWKLVEGRGSRDWIDEDVAEKAIKRTLGAKEAYVKKLISPPQAEKIVGKDHLLLGPKYVTKSAGKPTLVPESDKRPALVVDVSDGFDAV